MWTEKIAIAIFVNFHNFLCLLWRHVIIHSWCWTACSNLYYYVVADWWQIYNRVFCPLYWALLTVFSIIIYIFECTIQFSQLVILGLLLTLACHKHQLKGNAEWHFTQTTTKFKYLWSAFRTWQNSKTTFSEIASVDS